MTSIRPGIPTQIGPGLAIKLGSVCVHAQELIEPGGHLLDAEALRGLVIKDEEVASWLRSFGPALLPVKRPPPAVFQNWPPDNLAERRVAERRTKGDAEYVARQADRRDHRPEMQRRDQPIGSVLLEGSIDDLHDTLDMLKAGEEAALREQSPYPTVVDRAGKEDYFPPAPTRCGTPWCVLPPRHKGQHRKTLPPTQETV